jgi:DNA mismatch repair protein MutS2
VKSEVLAEKLDLTEYIDTLMSFFARPKPISMDGDTQQHIRYIRALEEVPFPEPPSVDTVDDLIARLGKMGVLSLDEIFRFVLMLRYFNTIKALNLQEPLSSWIHSMEIPDPIRDLMEYFTDDGQINTHMEPELHDIGMALERSRREIRDQLYRATRSGKLGEYLVDTQVHLYGGEETLLVRGGFTQAIGASVVGRSSSGFFYIQPNSVNDLKKRQDGLLSRKEAILWRYARRFSETLHKWVRFLQFVNESFDRLDHYQARVRFARARDFVFVPPVKGHKVTLASFAHPAISDPIAVDLRLERSVMLLTGVNAGGKTMLLKSILSAVFMSRHLLPFRCDPVKTSIGTFKRIEAIIDDPQSVKNDISTFAGRMLEFGRLFRYSNAIVGVDEIELGTDADEAAALFKVLIEHLRSRGNVFVVTTHHKRLAALMGDDDDTQLVAALYDEQSRRPTYRFLQGSIGKSYAFETAQRYGIPESIVEKAKEFYGEDKEKLGELIERSSELERELRSKIDNLGSKEKKLETRQAHLQRLEEQMKEEQRKALATYENRYNAATKRALEALKAKESTEGRRKLNEAHKHKLKARPKGKKTDYIPKVGDRIKYRSYRGEVISAKSKEATIEVDGLKMRVPISELKPSPESVRKVPKPKASSQLQMDKSRARVSVKLIGMYADEAEESLDRFISDALVAGLNEVEVIHGTGGGVLARLVERYLQQHPKIQGFYRMPGNLGATIVEI